MVALLRERFSTITLVRADGHAARPLARSAAVLALSVTIVKRTANVSGFVVLPRRWVVERTSGWLNRHRRRVRDYERLPEHHEAMLSWATTVTMASSSSVNRPANRPAHAGAVTKPQPPKDQQTAGKPFTNRLSLAG